MEIKNNFHKTYIIILSTFLTNCNVDSFTDNNVRTFQFNLTIQKGSVELQGVKITASRPVANSGRIISGTFIEGSEISIKVIPNDGYFFSNWIGIDETEKNIKLIGNSDIDIEVINLPIVCPNGDCWVKLYTDFESDVNGFFHVKPEWYTESSGRFNVYIESSPTAPVCQYGGVPVVKSKFDSDTFWEVESGLSFTFGLYNPFESLYTQQGNIIKVRDTTVTLDYFQGEIIPVVQETSIYHDVKDKMECYGWDNPNSGPTFYETGNCTLYSKRIIGPLITEMIGDTIKVFSETFFDCGESSKVVRDSISVIIN